MPDMEMDLGILRIDHSLHQGPQIHQRQFR